MKKNAKRQWRLSADRTRFLIHEALTKVGQPLARGAWPHLNKFRRGHISQIESLPAWVERFGFLAGPGQWCLWCDPLSSPCGVSPSQMVINVPCGRYMVETLDAAISAWISRESVEGGPMVAGLPYTGNPVLVWIHRLG